MNEFKKLNLKELEHFRIEKAKIINTVKTLTWYHTKMTILRTIYVFSIVFLFQTVFCQESGTITGDSEVKYIDSLVQKSFSALATNDYYILYRNYDNQIEFASSFPYDSIWIEANGAKIKSQEKNRAIVHLGEGRQCSIYLRAVFQGDTINLGHYLYRVSNLPDPSIYLGFIPLSNLQNIGDLAYFSMTQFYAKYPPEILLHKDFKIKEWIVQVGKKEYRGSGSRYSDELINAIYLAKKGTKIIYKSFVIDGFENEKSLNINTEYIKKCKRKTQKPSRTEQEKVSCG